MREIKFRSAHYNFNNTFSCFSYWGKIDHKRNYSDDCFTSPSSASSTKRKFEEQFTGLKDKNGVDIYEGDILEYKNDLGRNSKVKIFYKEGGLCFNTHNNDFTKEPSEIFFYESCADMQSKGWIVQFEVIGNIHENKELLK